MWWNRYRRRCVINLQERPDRRASVERELARLGMPFEFVRAVRGRDNPAAAWFFREVLRQSTQPRAGAIGCHLSHALIWIDALLDAGIGADEFVLVMEDDLKWSPATTNAGIERLLAAVPADANIVKFSVADWEPHRATLERRGQVRHVAGGVYRQTGLLGGTLMYAVRKAALASLIRHDYRGHFDNAIVADTYVLLPEAEGVPNAASGNHHFGVCYQGDEVSDVRPEAEPSRASSGMQGTSC